MPTLSRFHRLILASALLLLASAQSCSRREGGEASRAPAIGEISRDPAPRPAGASEPRASRATTVTVPVELSARLSRPAVNRLIAIGDLHGDLEGTRRALRLAGAIDEHDQWIGGTLTIVQTGDVIDRGDDDRAVLELLERLQVAARSTGGEVILLHGNHELMNVAADLRYVTSAALESFAAEGGRAAAFAPGGPFARRLSERALVVKVGASVFVHGGILPKHVAYGLDRMDEEVRAWMRGELPTLPDIMMMEDGPLWTRGYSLPPEDCAALARALDALGAKRMIVGHTVQRGINSACGERVWRIDVGIARFYGGPTEVLEIQGDRLEVRRSTDT